MAADTIVMEAEAIKQGLIACFKDPEVTAILKEEILAPLIQQAVTDAVAAKDEEIDRLKTEIAHQKQVINDLEQYSRKNCLTISGLPERANESVSQTVIDLARVVGVDLLPTDLDVAHRLGSQGRNERHIIAKFVRFEKREELYAARRRIRSAQLPPNSVISADVAAKVFISDSLTRHNQQIMYVARQLKRKGKLHATWSDAGKLKVRVRQDGPTTIIKSLDDIRKLTGDDPALNLSPTASPDGGSGSAPGSGGSAVTAAAPADRSRDDSRRGKGRGGSKKR